MSSNGRLRSEWAVLLDFDGTVTQRDVGEMLLDAFADSEWRRFVPQREAGIISSKECLELEFGCLPAKKDVLLDHARSQATPRKGFSRFLGTCQERAIGVEVVSCGLDFYVGGLLTYWGMEGVPWSAPRAVLNNGHLAMTYPEPGACDIGYCKCRHLERLKEQGYRVAYGGDGFTDRCPGAKADLILARADLRQHCEAAGTRFIPCDDFDEVAERLIQEIEALAG